MAGAEPFPAFNSSADQPYTASNENNARLPWAKTSAPATPAHLISGTGLAGNPSPPSSSSSSAVFSSNGEKDVSAVGAKKFSKRRKARTFVRRCKHFAVKHTWAGPLVLLLAFLVAYTVNPTESNPAARFIFLSYKLPLEADAEPDTPHQYGKGLWDIAFVTFYAIVLSFTREFIMQELLRPLARYCGLRSKGKQYRFMEQMYTAIYFGVLGPVGMFVMSRTPVWYFNTRGMYENFPHKTHEAIFKFYYLFQAAYWAQQAIVLLLGLEKRRKDFKELVGHHIVSLALIALSYRFHFTYMGLAVYITHDISDFFPRRKFKSCLTSKTMNYLDSIFMGPYFALFMGMWIYLRHYLNLKILFSLFTEFRTVGPYEMDWEAGQFKCLLSNVITGTLLASLQALNLFWLFFIIRIAYRFAFAGVAKDDRSDGDDSEEEEEPASQKEKDEATPLLNGSNGAANGAPKARANGTGASPNNKKKASR
ncbi:LAG1-domain-containing protein [Apiospora phragmitis]|uniref:LAG1-domain-containing protein n=1 Tax=Apiospora phragmitis TaxID=2905665 RepID=A0ABR1TRV8_9PEZI